MKQVEVDLGERSYPVLISRGLLGECPRLLRERGTSHRLFLISNPAVFGLFGDSLVEGLTETGFEVTPIRIGDGERFKSLSTVDGIYTRLIAHRADRESTIVGLGGGVTGDVAGFVAATFLRGLPFIQIPTTLLAQVDSALGGKTGVNHPQGKNMIGAFHQPRLVCVDTDTLATLPARELASGLYEVIKYSLIYDRRFFEYLEENLEAVLDRQSEVLEEAIARCCRIKAEIVSVDEKETGLRRILNFGHTFGHALEVVFKYQEITHGEAVGVGMLAAVRLSRQLGLLEPHDERRIGELIARAGSLPPTQQVTARDLHQAMQQDKKRRNDRQVFVLLEEIGTTQFRDDISFREVAEAWEQLPVTRQ